MTTSQTLYQPAARLALGVALLLMVPLLAMQVTDEVVWTASDFVTAGILLFGTGLLYLLGSRRAVSGTYRAAVGLALGAALLLVWANLAVGVIGDEGNRANLMYAGVLAVGIAGAFVARLRPREMARALLAMAAAQALVAAIALAYGLGGPAGALEIVATNGFFVALFVGSAWLFRRSARERGRAAAGEAA